MIARLLALTVVFAAVTQGALAQPQTPIGLQHGWQSGPSTWNSLKSALQADGRFLVPDPVLLSTCDPVAQQATAQLHPWLVGNFGASTPSAILVGHSLGGLVTRYGTRADSVQGVLTVGTPNYGAALAGGGNTADAYTNDMSSLIDEIDADFQDVQTNDASYLYNDVQFVDSDANNAVYPALNWVALAVNFMFNFRGGICASLHDMTPTGWEGSNGFIDDLDNNTNLEKVGIRQALRFQLDDSSDFSVYNGGPARLFLGANEARDAGDLIILYGELLEQDGSNILNELQPDDPYYYEHQSGGWAAIYEGEDTAHFAAFWNNDMLGGIPNDALIFTGSQGMPNGLTFNSNFHLMHLDETTHANSDIIARIVSMLPLP